VAEASRSIRRAGRLQKRLNLTGREANAEGTIHFGSDVVGRQGHKYVPSELCAEGIDRGLYVFVRIPTDVARHSDLMSPTIPI
jgi:hypothetical protein